MPTFNKKVDKLKPVACAFAWIWCRSSGRQYTLIGGLPLRVALFSFSIVPPVVAAIAGCLAEQDVR